MSDKPTWSVVDNVQAARNPQEAILVLAQAMDEILDLMRNPPRLVDDGWGEWASDPSTPVTDQAWHEGAQGPAFTETQIDETTTVYDVRPVSEEKQERRASFAQEVLQLPTQDCGVEPSEAVDTYVKLGPWWLYTSNRELFMQYAWEVRQAMVIDVNEEDPIAAQHMGADVLKVEEGAGEAWVRTAEAFGGPLPE